MPPTLDEAKLCPLGIEILKAARKKGHATLKEAAIAVEISYSQLYDLATGRKDPKLSTIQRIAAALGTTAAKLVASS